MVKAHIVNHTHWDREWYFTSSDALVLSEQLFTEVIEELLTHPEASFVLDGQTSILDDYLVIHPDRLDDIKYLVAEKRLFIGPWFTQTDAFYAHAESVLRNGMIGIFESKKYGEYMPIGYLPDTFGFNAQMPVLLEHLGLDNIIFWRGIHLGKHVKSTYFKWSGIGGNAEIYAINMPQGYGTGMLLEPTSKYVDERLDPAIEFIEKHSATSEVLIPSGNDQLNIIHDFSKKLDRINTMGKYEYIISDYTKFLDYVKKIQDLEVYQGEFREPVHGRVHKSIGSSRMNIKIANNRIENKLLHRIEPLLVIAKACGIYISERLLMQIWKKVFEGQAHDSLGGCVSDAVAEDIIHRFKEANEMVDSIENTILKRISDDLQLSDQEVLVVNTDLHAFSGYKDIQIVTRDKNIYFPEYPDAVILDQTYIPSRENILEETPSGNQMIREPGYYVLKVRIHVDLPGLGYKVIHFEKKDTLLEQVQTQNSTSIENEYYKILFSDNNVDLHLPNGEWIPSFITLEDSGNAGDTYDFSPLKEDKPYSLSFNRVKVEKSSLVQHMILWGDYTLPLDLEDRLTQKLTGQLGVKLIVTLTNSSELIDCKLEVDNQIYSHRLRVVLKTGIQAPENIASLPFGYIKRKPGVPENWENIYCEMPIDLEPMEQNVTLTTEDKSFTVFTKGIKEYQQIDEKLAITLLATTGQLGKSDLIYRPGRASGDTTKKGHVMIPTEGAQLIGKHDYSFAIYVGSGRFDELQTAIRGQQYLQENVDYQRQSYNYFLHRLDNKIQTSSKDLGLERTMGLMQLPENYVVSACHPSFYQPGKFIIRLVNPTDKPFELDSAFFADRNPEIVNALEEVQEGAEYIIPSYGVISIRVNL